MISLARRKFSRNRYFALICLAFILISLNLIEQIPVDENPKSEQIENSVRTINFSWPNDCSFNLNGDFLETNEKPSKQENDQRIRPSLGRIKTLFDKLMNNEEKFGEVFDFLAVFRFNEFRSTLKPFSNDTKKFKEIVCLFERFLVDPKTKKLSVSNEFILYLEQISNYLASGFHREHSTWKQTEKRDLEKPTIVLATDQRFFDSFQASIKTVDQFFPRNVVAVYDLGLNSKSKTLIQEHCRRCLLIPFPFDKVKLVAPHIRSLGNFAWKPIVVQDAVLRFGTIIYGDTSVRYKTSDFDRLLIDNQIRGFSCRELPGHYLPCYTFSQTFSWFQEQPTSFENIYVAEAGFLAVTDNFLSRLILKAWVTCALDSSCIEPQNGLTSCSRQKGSYSAHRYDQSAMVTVLSYFFFPGSHSSDKSDPAPYDMYSSIQRSLADVKRFEGDSRYLASKTDNI